VANFGAIAGLISAGLFVIPAVRQELRRRDYAEFEKQAQQAANNPDTKNLKDHAEKMMVRLLIRWELVDSLCVIFGIAFLALSFLVEFLFSS
jgi:hypothetical protein